MMTNIEVCPECGVPEYITSEHLWLNNGDIVQKRNQGARLIIMESENIDPLLQNIEEIIGVPIEHIVITTVRRAVRAYVSRIVPDDVKDLIHKKEMDPVPIALAMIDVAKMMGHGDQEYVGYRYEGGKDDYYTVKMIEPYSVPMVSGTIAGAVEAVFRRSEGVTYEQESPTVYKVTSVPSDHPEELKQRMQMEPYQHRDGAIELERCDACGGPKALSNYRWYVDRGVIMDEKSERRLVMMGPEEMDRILDELKEELGETIDQVIVEAQRRFTRSGFYSISDARSEDEFRNLLALRGFGNLKEIGYRKDGMHMRLDSAALPLMVVGMMQGVYEKFTDRSSTVEWELSEDGNLEIAVSLKTGG
jgi:hypothetical protein